MSGLESARHPRGAWAPIRTLTGLLGVVALAACVSSARIESASSPVAGHVIVHNRTGHELAVFLARPGKAWHLGPVGGLADADLLVPAEARPQAGDVHLIAWKSGGPMFSSESFPLPEGGIAEWTIGRQQPISYAAR